MKFKIYKQNGKSIIEHIEYPKLKGVITFNSPISDIEDIQMIYKCDDVMMLARLMREAGEFIRDFIK